MKVLMNAEAFGFGPSATIASLFPHLKNLSCITELSFCGESHSLDLQKKLSYNHIFNTSSKEEFKELVKNYDVFITALDFEKATWAREEKVHTIIYDSLFWYWKKLPQVIDDCQYYLIQDFFGVKDRVAQNKLNNYDLIPPAISNKKSSHVNSTEFVLINFGGLENPLWDLTVTRQYMKNILNSLVPYLEKQGKKYKIACSEKHALYFIDYNAKHYSYEKMQELIQTSSFIYATSGLGNIYECAQYQKKCCFLPPANDSQGRQAIMLNQLGFIDSFIDWSHMNQTMNYEKNQKEVLEEIKKSIINFDNEAFNKRLIQLSKKNNVNLPKIFNELGTNGKEILVEKLIQHIQNVAHLFQKDEMYV